MIFSRFGGFFPFFRRKKIGFGIFLVLPTMVSGLLSALVERCFVSVCSIFLITNLSKSRASFGLCSSSVKNPLKITFHGNMKISAPKHATKLSKVANKIYWHYAFFLFKIKCFKQFGLGKGLEGVEVMSVLKHKPKIVVNGIFCMIVTTLLSMNQYTLFFQPNFS